MGGRSGRNNGRSAISLEEARTVLCNAAVPMDFASCSLKSSLGRIIAEDLTAALNQPPFRRSAMDGYALRSEDIRLASPETPVTLAVRGCMYAGDEPLKSGYLKNGEAVRIMTGAAVPDDADLVIRQEETDEGEKTVRIYSNGGSRSNISPIGEDFASGECLIEKGTLIDAYALSCASAAGYTFLPVRRKIRVGLIVTGNELCPPGQTLLPGKIYNSNEAFLEGRLTQLGCELADSVYAEDRREKITDAIVRLKSEADLIITTGGVSVGERDLVPEALKAAGAEILFHGIAIKPGMPTLGAVFGGIPLLGLSGNPYSAASVFELLGRPLCFKMLCRRDEPFMKAAAQLDGDVVQNSDVPRVLRGTYDGRKVHVQERQRNARMKTGVGTNCMLILPAGKAVYRAGEAVEILL